MWDLRHCCFGDPTLPANVRAHLPGCCNGRDARKSEMRPGQVQ